MPAKGKKKVTPVPGEKASCGKCPVQHQSVKQAHSTRSYVLYNLFTCKCVTGFIMSPNSDGDVGERGPSPTVISKECSHKLKNLRVLIGEWTFY